MHAIISGLFLIPYLLESYVKKERAPVLPMRDKRPSGTHVCQKKKPLMSSNMSSTFSFIKANKEEGGGID